MSREDTPTAHIAAQYDDIAKTVIMCGDPLRAKFIAEKYLDSPKLFNEVRGMLGYTGLYKGKRVSVMGHGMGIPSIGIYSYELFNFFDVENIIRVGTAGALTADMKIGDMVEEHTRWYKLLGITSCRAGCSRALPPRASEHHCPDSGEDAAGRAADKIEGAGGAVEMRRSLHRIRQDSLRIVKVIRARHFRHIPPIRQIRRRRKKPLVPRHIHRINAAF